MLIVTVLSLNLNAQEGQLSKKEVKQLEKDGEFFFEKEDYEGALVYFSQLLANKPNDSYYNLVVGICYTYDPDQSGEALQYLEKSKELNPSNKLIDLYIARAYYKNLEFEKAIEILNQILRDGEIDNQGIDDANELLGYCKNSIEFTEDTLQNVRVINLGPVINSKDDEYSPIVTPDESRMVFTYRGEKSIGGKLNDKGEPDEHGRYTEDIYISFKSPDDWMYDEDVWLEPTSISINSDLDDASIALSLDAQTIFLYKFDQENGGDIFYSHLDGKVWGELKALEGDVNTKHWEGSMTIASDGQVLYFSSDKPGGMGGRDLYRAEMQEDGTWGNVSNLGPVINTPLNDDSPYLHLDRKTLYFSSQGHNSMGGYDVYFSQFEDGEWSVPVNMGAPVNTTEDDLFYVPNADGGRGYYSTAYGPNSHGKQDIYLVTPDVGKLDLQPIAALVLGIIYGDDVPVKAEIRIWDETNDKTAGTFYSNSASGEYRIALLPGSKYSIEVENENYPVHKDEIDLTTLKEYIEVSNNIYLYTEEYAEANEIVENTPIETAVVAAVAPPPPPPPKEEVVVVPPPPPPPKEEVVVVPPPPPPPAEDPCGDVPDLSVFIGKDLNIVQNYNNLKGEIGEYCADELEYRVQIGAYRFPQNFKYPHLASFGDALIRDYPDGITRFTMGLFTTLNEADALRQKIRAAGTDDAWVIPFYDGERIFMEDLISVNFYKQVEN